MYETFIGLGIVASLLYNEMTDLSPGGLITPGYIALFLDQPLRVLMTLILALTTYVIVKVLTRYFPIYGKRRFATCVIVAITLKMILSNVEMFPQGNILMQSIGLIIPGLISSDMLKQKVLPTITSLTIVSGMMYGILIVIRGIYI